MSDISPDRIFNSKKEQVVLKKEYEDMLILDVGGGGEGIIGKIYGRNVIAIDRSLAELEGTNNDSIKIVMDGRDLKFTNNIFDVATLFFTLMYMNEEEKRKCLSEIKRVLKPEGILEIWDTRIPKYDGGKKDIYVTMLNIVLPDESIDTGYGTLMRKEEVNLMTTKAMLNESGFKIIESEECDGGIYRIKCIK